MGESRRLVVSGMNSFAGRAHDVFELEEKK